MYRHVLLTGLTTAALGGLYGGYAGLVTPWLSPPATSRAAAINTEGPSSTGPPVANVKWARGFLPAWAASARWQVDMNQTVFYAGRRQADAGPGGVRFAPFALVHSGTAAGSLEPAPVAGPLRPIVVQADAVLVQFADDVDLDDPDFRLAVGCRLEGLVRITGPENLQVVGSGFVFEKSTMQLHSAEPVRFRYGPHSGKALGIQIELAGPNTAGRSGPLIKTIRLNRAVSLDVALDDSAKLSVVCDGPFEFDLVQQTAVFEQNVRARRSAGPGTTDSLSADRLELAFESAAESDPQLDQAGLAVRRLTAWGRPLRLESTGRDMVVRARRLDYDASTRTVTLAGDVEAEWADSEIQCPRLTIVESLAGQIVRAVCEGAGRLSHRHGGVVDQLLSAIWSTRLTMTTDPASGRDVIELEGDPLVKYGRDRALTASLIRIWFDRKPGGDKTQPERQGARVRLRELLADKRVGAIGPGFYVATDRLRAWFEDPPPRSPAASSRQPLASSRQPRRSGETKPETEPRVVVSADSIQARFRWRAERDGLDLVEAAVERRVRVIRDQTADGQHEELTGDRVHLLETARDGAVISVTGQPARFWNTSWSLTGNSFQFEEGRNRARVIGSGTVTVPIRRDADGKLLLRPEELEVNWQDHLTFDGLTATFFGDVHVRARHRRLECEELAVELTRRVPLDRSVGRAVDVEPRSLSCRHGVGIAAAEYTGEKLTGLARGRVADLEIDLLSGASRATGPGWIAAWRWGSRPPNALASATSARANRPSQLEPSRWTYTRINFADSATGNLKHRHATFHDQVQVYRGPVGRPPETVSTENPGPDDAWMFCNSLQVSRAETPLPGITDSIELLASGDATFDGRMCYGRSDTISYDEAHDRVLLRSFGPREATLWWRTKPNARYSRFDAKRIEFQPRRRQFIVDRSRGLLGEN